MKRDSLLFKVYAKIVLLFTPRRKYVDYLRKYIGIHIGDNCEVYRSANFGSEPYLVFIGDHVRINSGVHFINHDGGCWVLRKGISNYQDLYHDIDKIGVIRVGNNVHIGTNSFIMPGVTIGNNVIIGCCSVVTHDIPDNSVVAGVPARFIETIDEYAAKNSDKFLHCKNMKSSDKEKYLLSYFFPDEYSSKKRTQE